MVGLRTVFALIASMFNHWVVRTNSPPELFGEPFGKFEIAERTWRSLSLAFPEMLSSVLMPNHLHLILPQRTDLKRDYCKLGGIISNISKSSGFPRCWQSIPPPQVIPDRYHLRRQLRYIALNPCRKGLCADPLEWWWSTYREVMGAAVRPTIQAERIAKELNESVVGFQVRFHAYVSGDPSVNVAGTRPPFRCSREELQYRSLHQILLAASAALRVSQSSILKRRTNLRPLFVHLAYHCGWVRRTQLLADVCGVSPRAIHFLLKQPPPEGIEVAELCLSDDRLTKGEKLHLRRS